MEEATATGTMPQLVAAERRSVGQVGELPAHRFRSDASDPRTQHRLPDDVHNLTATLVQDRLPANLRRDQRTDSLGRNAVLGEELLATCHLAHEGHGLEQARHERRLPIKRLAGELDAVGAIPLAWRTAFLAVPRHNFLRAQIWVDDEHGNPQSLSRDDDPLLVN